MAAYNVLASFLFPIQAIIPIEALNEDEAINVAKEQLKDKKELNVEIYHEPTPAAPEAVSGAGDVRSSAGSYDTSSGFLGEASEAGSEADTVTQA